MNKTISGKTGTTGAVSLAGGASIAPLVVWGLGLAGVDVPPEVAVIIGGVISSLAAILVAWLMPARSGTYVEVEDDLDEDVYDPAVEAGIEDDPEIPDPSEFDLAEVV